MRKSLVIALSTVALSLLAGPSLGQQNTIGNTTAPINESNATQTAGESGQFTFDQLLGFLNAAEVPDAAAGPLVGADIEAIAQDSEVNVVPVTELEGWTGDRAELDKLITARGQQLGELHAAIESRPDLVTKIEGAQATVEDVLIVSTPGTGIYTFYVDAGGM